MNILGISAYYHDSAAALVRDGEIVAAVQEERFSRRKHDARFPSGAVAHCLETAGISISDVDMVAFYERPYRKFDRIIKTHTDFAPFGFSAFSEAMSSWIGGKLNIKDHIRAALDYEGDIRFVDHHASHAMSAFYPSPFRDSAVLTVDGVGEWSTTSIAAGRGNKLDMLSEIRFPHSLGLLYSAFTAFTGFKVNSGEYKMMGLAPYGRPVFTQTILENLIDLKDDGSFALNLDYFSFPYRSEMTNNKFAGLLGGPARSAEGLLTQREMDLARSIQDVVEEAIIRMGRHIRASVGLPNLCMAGGVALNCVANGRLLKEGIFDGLWVQPAAGDAGGALGAALGMWFQELGNTREPAPQQLDGMSGSYLGPGYDNDEIEAYLKANAVRYECLDDSELVQRSAKLLADENVVGWFQGRAEFGPRALGNRTILGDPRSRSMQSTMNLKIKFRESFRPFAPSVLRDEVANWFELDTDSPYMLLVAPIKKSRQLPMTAEQEELFGIEKLNVIRSEVPAVTHVDYSARVQTIHEETNPLYHQLVSAFYKLTGCPLVVNTSFNVRGEPPVCSPEDAYRCFMRTDMDYLVLGNFILSKADQTPLENDTDWRKEFELD